MLNSLMEPEAPAAPVAVGGRRRKSSSKPKPKAKAKSKAKGPKAPQRNLVQEGRDAVQVMKESAPELLALQQEFGPQFARAEAATSLARSQAERDGVKEMGTSIRDAVMGASPEIADATNALGRQIREQGPSEIETELRRQALSELKLGGSLSADEVREVSQGSRAAWSARGLGQSQAGAVEEVLARTGAAEARKAGRRQFASAIDSQATARENADRAFTMNAGNTAMAWYDPYARMYGRGGASATTGAYSGPQNFEPYLGAAGNVGASNQEAATRMMLLSEQQKFGKWQLGQQLAAEKENFKWNAEITARNDARNRSGAMSGAAIAAGGAILAALI